AVAAGALDDGGDGTLLAGADDEVALPVARHGPVGGLGGTLGDVDHRGDLGAAPLGTALGLAPCAFTSQAPEQFFLQLAAGLEIDGLVDGLVGHPPLWLLGVLVAEPAGDGLGRPRLGHQQLHDVVPQPPTFLEPAHLGTPGGHVGTGLGTAGVVALSAAIGLELPPHRAAVPSDTGGDVAFGLAAPRQVPLRGAATGFFPSTPQLRRRLLRWLRSQTPPALLALPTRATSDDPLRHLLARSCRADRLRAPGAIARPRPPECAAT